MYMQGGLAFIFILVAYTSLYLNSRSVSTNMFVTKLEGNFIKKKIYCFVNYIRSVEVSMAESISLHGEVYPVEDK